MHVPQYSSPPLIMPFWQVEVPQGAVPGSVILITSPEGKPMRLAIPEGAGPGFILQVGY
jgi:hypothetical protein